MSKQEVDHFVDATKLDLETWLELMKREGMMITWCFPTDEYKEAYIQKIQIWSDTQIQNLLAKFLMPTGTTGLDEFTYVWLLHEKDNNPDHFNKLIGRRHYQRVMLHFGITSQLPVWNGITWVLDLLPHWPKVAIEALNAYLLAHAQALPDGRYSGLLDAIEIIRAKYIGIPGTRHEAIELLKNLTPRQFECIVEQLFKSMGYDTALTPAGKDGGWDIEVVSQAKMSRTMNLVECKKYEKPVPVEVVRALFGVVNDRGANKGIVVSTGKFTRGACRLATSNPRLELITGDELVGLMNEYLGASWPLHIERLASEKQGVRS